MITDIQRYQYQQSCQCSINYLNKINETLTKSMTYASRMNPEWLCHHSDSNDGHEDAGRRVLPQPMNDDTTTSHMDTNHVDFMVAVLSTDPPHTNGLDLRHPPGGTTRSSQMTRLIATKINPQETRLSPTRGPADLEWTFLIGWHEQVLRPDWSRWITPFSVIGAHWADSPI